MRRILQRVLGALARLGRRVGDVQARVLLTFVYFVVLAPFALAVRWFADPLSIKPGAAAGWRSRAKEEGSPLERARKHS